jgi:Txe/YoeB family toxin of Txe-Axe toxin-antitoxin module
MQKTTNPIKNKKTKTKIEELLNQSKRRPLKWVSDTKHHKSTGKHKRKA